MAKKNDSANAESSAIFSEKVGDVSIRMMLDIRNRKQKDPDDIEFPLCIRFVLDGKRSYYRLGESFTEEELKAIRLSSGFGEKTTAGKETRFQTKMRLNSTFMQYVATVRGLAETGPLTLSRIITALTGKSDVSSIIDVWENYLKEKIEMGKVGTAHTHDTALKSFIEITKFKKSDGFAVDSDLVRKWGEGMKKKGNSATTIGMNFRNLRAIINVCISEGYMQPKDKMFGVNVRKADKVKIPTGGTRKDRFIPIDKMTELYLHWKNHDFDLPLYRQGEQNKPYAIKEDGSRERVYRSVAMFLAQYLGCGCNLADLALLEYNDFYFHNDCKAFRFIRIKSEDTANQGEGTEVIIPITEPLQDILDTYATKPEHNAYVFPFILGEELLAEIRKAKGEIKGQLAIDVKVRMKQENHNIGDHMKKIADSLGWEERLSGTWARHSFATNMFTREVPKHYISDAMGHTIENRGDITDRYISAYSIDKRMKYNRLLLDLGDKMDEDKSDNGSTLSPTRMELYSMMDDIPEEDLMRMLLRAQADKLRKK